MDNSGGVAMPQVTSEHQNKIREKILKSTYRLFVREGERMTTQMVCDDAHVSKGTLFHYFGSKESPILRRMNTQAASPVREWSFPAQKRRLFRNWFGDLWFGR